MFHVTLHQHVLLSEKTAYSCTLQPNIWIDSFGSHQRASITKYRKSPNKRRVSNKRQGF